MSSFFFIEHGRLLIILKIRQLKQKKAEFGWISIYWRAGKVWSWIRPTADRLVFLARQLYSRVATLPGCFSSLNPRPIFFVIFFLGAQLFFICCFSNSIIFYRTGLPLVSPAILEPMGLPTDFKLLPKVNRPFCSNLSKDWNDINWWELPLRFCLVSLFNSSVCQYLEEVGYVSHALGSWGLGFCHPDYLPTK